MRVDMESKVRSDCYVTIQGWMLNKLNLKNNELIIFAIIYGFSQSGEDEYTGSLQYLADWCGCTKQGVIKCLKSLIEKDYIIKTEKFSNGVKFCSYKASSNILI
jgi:hypothetical protein